MRNMRTQLSNLSYLPRSEAPGDPRLPKLAWVSPDGVKFWIAHTDHNFLSRVSCILSHQKLLSCSYQNCVVGSMLSDDGVFVEIFLQNGIKSIVRREKLKRIKNKIRTAISRIFILFCTCVNMCVLFSFYKILKHRSTSLWSFAIFK